MCFGNLSMLCVRVYSIAFEKLNNNAKCKTDRLTNEVVSAIFYCILGRIHKNGKERMGEICYGK